MEAFSLLKYWKGGGGLALSGGNSGDFPAGNGTILAAVSDHSAGDFDYSDSDGDDEGPFFDLEFAVPAEPEEEEDDEIEKVERENGEVVDDQEEDDDDEYDVGGGERELKLTQSSSMSSCEHNVSLSPSDDLLFKGRIVRIDGSEDEDQLTPKSGQFPIPVTLLRSATKFRVFMLGLKRSKSETKSQQLKQNQQQNNNNNNNNNRKLFTVKFKVMQKSTTEQQQQQRNKKEVMQKYLKLVNPRNIRASKRSQEASPAAETAEERENTAEETAAGRREMKGQKVIQGLNLKGIMMANKKHLGKSKSAVVYSTVQQNAASNRRDDSLLQQQDGIQGAILHCKRSFNASARGLEEREESEAGQVLTRSASDPTHEKKRTTTELITEDKKANNDAVLVSN